MPSADEKPPDGAPRPAGSPGSPRSHGVSADGPLVSGDMPSAVEKPPRSPQGSAPVMPAETGSTWRSPLTPAPLAAATLGATAVSGDMPTAVEKPPLGVPRSAGSPGTPGSQSVGADGPLVSGDMPGAVEKPPLSLQGTMVRYVSEASRAGVSTNELGGTTTPSWTVRYGLDSRTGVTANRGSPPAALKSCAPRKSCAPKSTAPAALNELGGTTTPSWTVRYGLESSTGVTANRGSLITRAPPAVVYATLRAIDAETPETPNGVASRAATARAATGLLEPRNRRAEPRTRVVSISVHLNRDFVDLSSRMARPLMDPHDRFTRWPAREAERLARGGVQPGALEMHALVRLDREVALVGLLELLRRHAHKPRVNVHEVRHASPLCSSASTIRTRLSTRSVDPRRRGVISRMTDDLQRTRPTLR